MSGKRIHADCRRGLVSGKQAHADCGAIGLRPTALKQYTVARVGLAGCYCCCRCWLRGQNVCVPSVRGVCWPFKDLGSKPRLNCSQLHGAILNVGSKYENHALAHA